MALIGRFFLYRNFRGGPTLSTVRRAAHRDRAAKNRALIEELEANSGAGSAEIDRLNAQSEQSDLIQATYDKRNVRPQQGKIDTTTTAPHRALTILREPEQAQADLWGNTVVLSDGKAGTVEKVKLNELHGLRVTIAGHEGDWPILNRAIFGRGLSI